MTPALRRQVAPVPPDLLAKRVSFASAVAAGVGLVFLVYRVITGKVSGYEGIWREPSLAMHAAGTLCFAAGWWACRIVSPSIAKIRVIEAVSFLGGCIAFVAMGYYIPVVGRPELIMVLSAGIISFGRAAYVPSSGAQTLAFGVVIGVPMLAVSNIVWQRGFVASDWGQIYPPLADLTPAQAARGITLTAGVWWMLIVAVCAMASRRIYGLRTEVATIKKLGQYALDRKLGQGGMGVVYSAHHAMLRRPTAIKLLHPEKAGVEQSARFEREVRLTAKLAHPNTVTIFDYGRTPEGIFYYAMELLNGATLSEVVELSGPQSSARVAHILDAVSGALTEAHEIGLIHRDIKPANIMVCSQGGLHDVTKVLDFGLVKELESDGAVDLTNAATITGTPQYMSPESIKEPDSVDARSDLYSLGAVAYFLVTGRHVFEGKSVVEVCGKHLHEAPKPPSEWNDDVDRDLEELILECLAKKVSDRPDTAKALRSRLRRTPCFGQWSEDRAEQWWQEHAAALERLRAAQIEDASTHTVGIDLQARASRTTNR